MAKGPDKDITVTIGTPKGALEATFPKTTKVQEVIDFAIDKLGLGGEGDAFELFRKVGDTKEPLTPADRPLVSFGIGDGDKLLLAATGSGV